MADTIGLPVLSVYDLAVRTDSTKQVSTKQISTKQLHAALSAAAGTDTEVFRPTGSMINSLFDDHLDSPEVDYHHPVEETHRAGETTAECAS